ncbi:MAG: LysM peptidoglycan-binding domain-containing protein [Hyphomonadaceae bacterium]|nr:LysM peptidoglycan-binding domain-containing protein [Hyphomonadaceae bacterium]
MYTVRAGDSLSSIAAALWGDASLWYKLAEVNGLTGESALIEGQPLIVPVGVVRSENNATTFKPYDPLEVLGNTSPTAPKPHKQQCGGMGQVLLAVIAIAVVVVLKVPLTNFFTNMFSRAAMTTLSASATTTAAQVLAVQAGAAAAGAVAGGITAAAAGSIVSQGVGVATGIQDKFSWNAVALAAIGGGVGGSGVAHLTGSTVVNAALASAITQGIGVATGLQDKFSWAGVAAAGVGAGVGKWVGARLPAGTGAIVGRTAVNTASAIANAATRSLIDGSNFGDNVLAALPDVIGQTIGEAIAGRVAGNGNTTGGGERRGGVLSAIGDVLGFDGEFGYDGINGPTGEGRRLSLAGLGGAIGDVVGLDGQFGQQGMAGRNLSLSGLGDAIQDVIAPPTATTTGTYGDEASWLDTVQRLTELQTGIGDATFAEGMPDSARLIPVEGNWEAAERLFAPQEAPNYSDYEDITGQFADFARLNPEESERLRFAFDPFNKGYAEDAGWIVDILAGGIVGGLRAGAESGILNFGRSSAWRLGWGDRGRELERLALGSGGRRGLHPDFPVFDRVWRGRATSVVSIDLAAEGYIRNPSAVASTLIRKLNSVANYTVETYARRTIQAGVDFTAREMLVVVPRGAMTVGQRQALQAVYQQGVNRGVTVIIRRF